MNTKHSPKHGLTISEQAAILWAVCRYASQENPESCPVNLLPDLRECPFDCDCGELPTRAWFVFLEKRDNVEEGPHGAE